MMRLFVCSCATLVAAVDPLELLPPGVSSGLAAKLSDEQPYTLNLMPPEEATSTLNAQVDSLFKIEKAHERGMEQLSVAQKQRILNAEIAKVKDIVAHAAHKSFLRKVMSVDHEIDLHPPVESAADIQASVNEILKSVTGRAQSEAAYDNVMKQQLLAAEIGKIKQIVASAY